VKILLVEPNFPISSKSKNHKDFLPIGLLKLASYYRDKGYEIKLVRGNLRITDFDFEPDEIMITSLFTYWSSYVKESAIYYKEIFPKAKVTIGGIYASLMPEHCLQYTKCNNVYVGVHKEAEKCEPAYDLISNNNPHPIEFQIIHSSRGCPRRCKFCGTWIIEPKFKSKKSINREIRAKNIVFYDNNFLMNPHIESILEELIKLKKNKKISWCESQSGFDGRILIKKPILGRMLKAAGFRYPRIAWDWGYNQNANIKKQIDILINAGYKSKEIYIFVLYNWDILFEEMEKKRIKCWHWKVQIADCRYRPLNQMYDNYKPKIVDQSSKDYYVHKGWDDALIKQFRKNVRRQNICVRQDVKFYSPSIERKKISKEKIIKLKDLSFEKSSKKLDDTWNPADVHYPYS